MSASAEHGHICTLLTLGSSQYIVFELFVSLLLNLSSGIVFTTFITGSYSVLESLLVTAQRGVCLS